MAVKKPSIVSPPVAKGKAISSLEDKTRVFKTADFNLKAKQSVIIDAGDSAKSIADIFYKQNGNWVKLFYSKEFSYADIAAGNVKFEPRKDMFGDFGFRFQIKSDSLISNSADFKINVKNVNDAPIALGANISTSAGSTILLSLKDFASRDPDDIDGTTLPARIKFTGLPSSGKLMLLDAKGKWVDIKLNKIYSINDLVDSKNPEMQKIKYISDKSTQPGQEISGIKYTVSDGKLWSNTADFKINFIDHPAVISGDISAKITAGLTNDRSIKFASGTINITDQDQHDNTSIIANTYQGKYGILVIDAKGQWTYTLNSNLQTALGDDFLYGDKKVEEFYLKTSNLTTIAPLTIDIIGSKLEAYYKFNSEENPEAFYDAKLNMKFIPFFNQLHLPGENNQTILSLYSRLSDIRPDDVIKIGGSTFKYTDLSTQFQFTEYEIKLGEKKIKIEMCMRAGYFNQNSLHIDSDLSADTWSALLKSLAIGSKNNEFHPIDFYGFNRTSNLETDKNTLSIRDIFSTNGFDKTIDLNKINLASNKYAPNIEAENPINNVIEANASSPLIGKIVVDDPDPGESGLRIRSTEDQYGIFRTEKNGEWSFEVKNDNSELKMLGEGEKKIVPYVIESLDGSTKNIDITILGKNDKPTALDNKIILFESHIKTLSLSDFLFDDIDHDTSISKIRISESPNQGKLQFYSDSSNLWSDIQFEKQNFFDISSEDISLGHLRFIIDNDHSGDEPAHFEYQVFDGLDWSSPAIMKIVDPIKDPTILINDDQNEFQLLYFDFGCNPAEIGRYLSEVIFYHPNDAAWSIHECYGEDENGELNWDPISNYDQPLSLFFVKQLGFYKLQFNTNADLSTPIEINYRLSDLWSNQSDLHTMRLYKPTQISLNQTADEQGQINNLDFLNRFNLDIQESKLIDLGDNKISHELVIKLDDFNDNLHNLIIDGGKEDRVKLVSSAGNTWHKTDNPVEVDQVTYTKYSATNTNGEAVNVFVSEHLNNTVL